MHEKHSAGHIVRTAYFFVLVWKRDNAKEKERNKQTNSGMKKKEQRREEDEVEGRSVGGTRGRGQSRREN